MTLGIPLRFQMSEEALKDFKVERDGDTFLVNLLDSSGHIEFPTDAAAAFRVTNGSLVVVDYKGLGDQTKTVLHQAMRERIRPVLVITKIDKLFSEGHLDGEEVYQVLYKIVDEVNAVLATYDDFVYGEVCVSPEKRTVAFSAGLHGWAFTLLDFASIYAKRMGFNANLMMEKLWGENFFDIATHEWTKEHTSSPSCKRGFVMFCYEPIQDIIQSCLRSKIEEVGCLLDRWDINLNQVDKTWNGFDLMKCVMQKRFPAGKTIMEMMILQLRSPAIAQTYRVEALYEGPVDDAYGNGIRNCDPDAPVMIYISKMVRSYKGGFLGFGRVFSGNVSTNWEAKIMDPSYTVGQNIDRCVTVKILAWTGKHMAGVDSVPCGNMVAVYGLDTFCTTNSTLTSKEAVDAHPLKRMRFSATKIFRVNLQTREDANRGKLSENLKILCMADPAISYSIVSFGQCTLYGTGEAHLRACLKDLRELMSSLELTDSEPRVSFRETILEASSSVFVGVRAMRF